MVVSENQVKCLVCVICKEIIKDEGENLRGDLGILAVTAWKLAKALANGGVIPEPEGKDLTDFTNATETSESTES